MSREDKEDLVWQALRFQAHIPHQFVGLWYRLSTTPNPESVLLRQDPKWDLLRVGS